MVEKVNLSYVLWNEEGVMLLNVYNCLISFIFVILVNVIYIKFE